MSSLRQANLLWPGRLGRLNVLRILLIVAGALGTFAGAFVLTAKVSSLQAIICCKKYPNECHDAVSCPQHKAVQSELSTILQLSASMSRGLGNYTSPSKNTILSRHHRIGSENSLLIGKMVSYCRGRYLGSVLAPSSNQKEVNRNSAPMNRHKIPFVWNSS